MQRDKAHREDQLLGDRQGERAPEGGESEHEDPRRRGRASRIWQGIAAAARGIPKAGSGEEDEVARGGLRDTGHELPFRAELEQQVGTDLSGVKAHSGPHARAAATQLGAHAYTVDQAVVLGTEQPSKDLVAHELTHVLQERGDGTGGLAEDEAEADAASAQLGAGEKIDPATLRGGGRGVRKKEKSPSEAFADLVASLAGAEEGDLEVRDDELGVRDAEDSWTHDGPGGRRIEMATKDTVDTRGGGIEISREETTTTGTVPDPAVERARIKAAIEDAQLELQTQIVLASFDQMKYVFEAKRLDAEIEKLAGLDPELVAAQQQALGREANAARKKAAAIEKEIAARQKLSATLDEGLADLAREPDPREVAENLAKAELAFKAKLTVTKKDAFRFSFVRMSLAHERSGSETTFADDGRSTTVTKGSKTEVKTSKGIRGEHTEKRGFEVKDADGNVESAEELEASARGGMAVGKDGSVGVDGGAKLAKSIENSHGKATSSAAFGGSVTVNVIALPRPNHAAPQQFSVVVTINLDAALAVGLSKGRAGKHGKGTAGIDASATFAGALTHTHILDEAGAEGYLEALEKAGNGDRIAAGKAPEFGVLRKALTGATSVDDVAEAATATVGSADAAASMGVDESVELTLKAGASLDVALGAEGKDKKSIGASAGASTETFRTLKIARVAGKPGQQLVDVTVMFGDKSDQHGALTASALGVTASVGKEQWGGGQSAVTFRLDASMEQDYQHLYKSIVATSSRAGLEALRKSPEFRAHVQSYMEKTEQGGSDSVGIKGLVGVAAKDSWTRSSSKSKDAEGNEIVEETGTSTTGVGFSVGPLELLRRSQTASAKFESRGGTSMVDLSEQTDQSELGFEVPTFQEFLAADSPIKALEDALVDNRRTLAGFLLDPHDLRELARRAKNVAAWSRVPMDAKVMALPRTEDVTAWNTLRTNLVHPKLDDAYGIEHIELAQEVALGRALADFMSTIGKAKGLRYLQVVLREYGKHGGDATELGVSYEFPKGIKPEDYINLRFELRSIDDKLSTMFVDANGEHPGLAYCAELEVETAKMIDKIQRAEFESERPRIEMLNELRELAIEVGAKRRELERGAAEAAGGRGICVDVVVDDAKHAVHHREETLIQSKVSEVRLLQRCERIMNDDDLYPGEISEQLEPILIEGGQLDQVYENHVRLIKSLRATYRAARTPESQWICSVDIHGDARTYDVDIDRALEALWAYYKGKPYDLGVPGYEPRRQRWNRKFWSY